MSRPLPQHLTNVLDRLENVRPHGSYWTARCPAHHDQNPSLSIGLGNDDRVLLKCHTDCPAAEIVTALGLTWKDLFPLPSPKQPGRLLATYLYHDTDSNVAGRVQRFDGEPKDFRQHAADGRGGFHSRLNGIALPLYRKPEVLKAAVVYGVEGEKNADDLRALGFVATTNPGGAGNFKQYHAEPLQGRSVILIPDNDDKGRRHVRDSGALIEQAGAREVSVLELPGLPVKGDVSDWIAAGGTADQLRALTANAPPYTEWVSNSFNGTPVVPLNELHHGLFLSPQELCEQYSEEIPWRWEGLIADGAITELDAKAKMGKSTLIAFLIAHILRGLEFLGLSTSQGPVLYLTEQSGTTFRELLARAGLTTSDGLTIMPYGKTLDTGLTWPEIAGIAIAKARELGDAILVVDTMPQWAGLKNDAENNSGAALEAMRPLQIAAENGLAVVIVRHDRKGGGEVGDSARGSSAFAGVVDIIVQMTKPEGNTDPTLRVLKTLSRYDDTPSELTIQRTTDGYICLGEGQIGVQARVRTKLLKVMPDTEGDASTVKELADHVGSLSTVREALENLVDEQVANKCGTGKRNDAFRYWRISTADEQQDQAATVSFNALKGEVPLNELNPDDHVSDSFNGTPPLRETNESPQSLPPANSISPGDSSRTTSRPIGRNENVKTLGIGRVDRPTGTEDARVYD